MNARRSFFTAALVLALCWTQAAHAGPGFRILATEAPQAVQLVAGKSLILNSDSDIARISLAAPEQAELVLISPRQIYITGKKTGTTNLTLWGPGDRVNAVYDLEVVPDVTQLKHMLHTVLPSEAGIRVLSSGESVTLSGSVSSATNLATALSLAEASAPGKVVNLLRVGGVQQVMLEVRVAEMSRSVMKRLGFNFRFMSGDEILYSFLNRLTYLDEEGALTLSNNVGIAGTTSVGSAGNSLSYFVDALKANGLIKILAEPNLICLSGQTAEFLAGGEVPIPVPQGLGTVGIEYKPFGVGLKFTPTVLDSGTINIKVEPQVSDLDYSRAVTVNSFNVPSITSRRASTTVELGNGQSFAIAGLIKDSLRENMNKFPVLGDVPVLGSLFRSSDFQKNESELIIIITPHLVKPLDVAKQSLPTDGFREPDDYEFYMLGLVEGRGSGSGVAGSAPKAKSPSGRAEGFDGEFGHMLPR
ncbi:type II and III secretion system protein family protein [Desulfovibrio aminophilus]|uniref:type II and III secretion system protein family protein n=1 Tax=Desulfovibrio aminophilus TaxID=81425 RepID=UPI0003FB4ABF|nr:type II and III secretion system protein family protein [Desulfovibrio aminophilus]